MTFPSVLCFLYFLYLCFILEPRCPRGAFRRKLLKSGRPSQLPVRGPRSANRLRHRPAGFVLALDHVEEGDLLCYAGIQSTCGALFIRLHQDFDSTIVVRTDFDRSVKNYGAAGSRDLLHHRSLPQLSRGCSCAFRMSIPLPCRTYVRMAHRLAASSKRRSSQLLDWPTRPCSHGSFQYPTPDTGHTRVHGADRWAPSNSCPVASESRMIARNNLLLCRLDKLRQLLRVGVSVASRVSTWNSSCIWPPSGNPPIAGREKEPAQPAPIA